MYYYLVSDDDSSNNGQRGTSYTEHLANPMREGGWFWEKWLNKIIFCQFRNMSLKNYKSCAYKKILTVRNFIQWVLKTLSNRDKLNLWFKTRVFFPLMSSSVYFNFILMTKTSRKRKWKGYLNLENVLANFCCLMFDREYS